MKKIVNIFVVVVMMCFAFDLLAQTDKDKDKKPPKPKPVPVYLGMAPYSSGNIKVTDFNSYMKQGLNSKDSLGNPYKVNGFTFTYGERNLYEDSVGKLMVVTDYLMEYCFGDTFSTFIINNITERSKPGDTVYIDNINLTSTDGKGAAGKSMKLVLTK